MVASGRSTPLSAGRRRESSAGTVADGSSVKVVVRIRPNPGSEAQNVPQRFQRTVLQALSTTTLQAESGGPAAASPAAAVAAAKHGGAKSLFTYDRVIGPDERQPAVYECASSLVDSFLEGMNATILAYGQTSSGKSYTMGTDNAFSDSIGDERQGITPRAVAEIFDRMKEVQRESKGATSFTSKVSYIEIYNEDLIDLLAGDMDARPTVQIREDKQGNIIWSGLREVKVSTAADVMNLLATGSTLRQTGATDMNAQSSRSHAIFSLTITQRKWSGLGPPPSVNTSPQSPRIANRLSGLPRVTSPTPGARASTPTSDRPGSRSGLRPPSQIGRPSSPLGNESAYGGADSWSTLTSKFHFVDLAGSERVSTCLCYLLKRTSALGERAKEGISIVSGPRESSFAAPRRADLPILQNAGLHALGNVISALGDPTKKATHIPYRDSKLTRLLQDSLGGNAKTMMIACVSPAEFNLHETLSTLKYANRARNIKNRAEINEVEVGWDDVEHLQRSILKLRAELAAIKCGDGTAMASIAEESTHRSLGATLPEFELQQKVAQLTAELAKAQSGGSTASSTMSRDQFERAVEPIVEEYERSLSALESQLSLTKAALGHSEDEMRDLEARIDEEVKANEVNSQLIDELRVRVAKLSEREATTEAYVRDLEAKLKDVDDADETHGLAVSDLRKELTRSREQAETTELYIKELEARLAKTDESNASLRRQIEVLERDVERREEAHRELETRLSLLDTSGEHKLLLAEIDEKDKRVLDLERDLDEFRMQAAAAAEETQRLQKLAEDEKTAREELQSRVRTLERSSVAPSVPRGRQSSFTPPQTPATLAEGEPTDENAATSSPSSSDSLVAALQQQIDKLQASHAETLAELDIAKEKYRDSLKEIGDLNSQVQEAKLVHSASDTSASDSATSPASSRFRRGRQLVGDDDEDNDEVEELMTPTSPLSSRGGSPVTLRTAARSPHARRSMPLSPQHRLSFLGRGQGVLSASSHSRSASLSQELSLAVSSQTSSPPGPRPVSPSPSSHSHRESFYGPSERSYEQMKNEVMKLQSVLNEREQEISALESTLHQLRTPTMPSSTTNTSLASLGDSPHPPQILANGRSTPPPSEPAEGDLNLSPRTRAAFDALKADLSGTGLGLVNTGTNEEEANASRLDDLMRSMAKKESAHREAIETLEEQLATLQRQHDELTVLSRDQVVNMSSEISKLRTDLEGRPEASHYESQLKALQDDLDAKGAELDRSRQEAAETLEVAKEELAAGTSAPLRVYRFPTLTCVFAEHKRLLELTSAEHAADLARTKDEHAEAIKRAADEQDEVLRQKEAEHKAAIESLGVQHEETVRLLTESHDKVLSESVTNNSAALAQLRDEHAAALETASADFERRLHEAEDAHSGERDKLREDHAAALDTQTSAHAAELAAITDRHSSQHESALEALAASHKKAVDELKDEHSTRLEELLAEQEALQQRLVEAQSNALSTQRDAHTSAFEDAQQQRESDLEQLRSALTEEYTSAREALAKEHGGALAALTADHQTAIERIKAEHEQILVEQQNSHSRALQEATSTQQTLLKAVEMERDDISATHEKVVAELEALRAEHAQTKAALLTSTSEHEAMTARFADLSKQHENVVADHQKKLAALEERLAQSSVSPANAELQEALDALSTLERALLESQQERERLLSQVQELRGGEDKGKSQYDSIFKDLEQYRASVVKLDSELVKTRRERDSLSAQLARASLSSNHGLGILASSPNPDSASIVGSPVASTPDRAMSPILRLTKQLSHCESELEQTYAKLNANAAEIARLESEHHADADLINTLESALNDSERNLRKTRMNANEIVRERDQYKAENERLRIEAQDSHTTSESYRQSVLDMEERLQEQRNREARAERARQELELRMQEAGRKRSKLQCF
ncbi:SPOSA6832_01442 [Sporobolomyces salmonicolor]|uniref:SPOSA6832_01442-mRNA-1:cds n=1 Tax=Sporidiobolus salmonicolor TaxID=5005 RepID=A0A0D6EJE2_SPOSA|nr:SPOSA6832_01442 [Sporobolomyces salmonicolor]